MTVVQSSIFYNRLFRKTSSSDNRFTRVQSDWINLLKEEIPLIGEYCTLTFDLVKNFADNLIPWSVYMHVKGPSDLSKKDVDVPILT